jgi:deazaflavin-dependent oxidoreductase (nitroreductase family)
MGAIYRSPVYQALVERQERLSPAHYPQTEHERADLRRPILAWRLGLGRLAGRVLLLITVTGRTSGLPRRTPVAPHRVGGRTYVWCPYGGRSQWYRNLVANPVATVQSHRGTQVVRAERLSDEEVVQVVEELRVFDAPWLRRYLDGEGVADTPEDLVRNKDRLHLRRLDPTTEPGPPALPADLAWVWLVPAALGATATAARAVRRRPGCRRSLAADRRY